MSEQPSVLSSTMSSIGRAKSPTYHSGLSPYYQPTRLLRSSTPNHFRPSVSGIYGGFSKNRLQTTVKKAVGQLDILRAKIDQAKKVERENEETQAYLFILEFKIEEMARKTSENRRASKQILAERYQKALDVLRAILEQQQQKLRAAEESHEGFKGFYQKIAREVEAFKNSQTEAERPRDQSLNFKRRSTINPNLLSTLGRRTVVDLRGVRGFQGVGESFNGGEGSISEVNGPNVSTTLYDPQESFKGIIEPLSALGELTEDTEIRRLPKSGKVMARNRHILDANGSGSDAYLQCVQESHLEDCRSPQGELNLLSHIPPQQDDSFRRQLFLQKVKDWRKSMVTDSCLGQFDRPNKSSMFVDDLSKYRFETHRPRGADEPEGRRSETVSPIGYASQQRHTQKAWTLEEFVKFKKEHKGATPRKLSEMIGKRDRADGDSSASDLSDDVQSANSDINESVLEELDEELEKTGRVAVPKGFSVEKIRSSYKPVKISFVVGVSDKMDLTPEVHRIQRDRVYRDFRITKIKWHWKDNALCGVKLYFWNSDMGMTLGGHFHGVRGDRVTKMVLGEGEGLNKIDLGFTQSEIRRLKLTTTTGSVCEMGVSEEEAGKEGLRVVSRYFPREVQLFTFFCKYNSVTRRIENIRFLYVKTLVFELVGK